VTAGEDCGVSTAASVGLPGTTGNVMYFVSPQNGDGNDISRDFTNGTVCYRQYRRWEAGYPGPNVTGDIRVKLARAEKEDAQAHPCLESEWGIWAAGDPSAAPFWANLQGCFFSPFGPEAPLLTPETTDIYMQDCIDSWCRIEICMDHNSRAIPDDQKIVLRANITKLSTGVTYNYLPQLSLGSNATAITGAQSKPWQKFNGVAAGFKDYVTGVMVAIKPTADETFWIGPATEIEGTNPAVTITLVATPPTVASGNTVSFSWTTTGTPDSCTPSSSPTDAVWDGQTINPAGSGGSPIVITPATSTTYSVQCDKTGYTSGNDSQLVTVTSTVALGATNSTIVAGQSTTLSWEIVGSSFTACTGTSNPTRTGWNSDAKAFTEGTHTEVVTPPATTEYTITCDGPTVSSTTVTVNPATTIALTFTPPTIARTGTSSLSWTTTGSPTACGILYYPEVVIDPAGSGGSPISLTNVQSNYSFFVVCGGPGGIATDYKVLTVLPFPTSSLSISGPTYITQGTSTTLVWSSTTATSCTGTNFSTGGAPSGTLSISPSATTQYALDCSASGGVVTPQKTATVTVTQSAPAPPGPGKSGSSSAVLGGGGGGGGGSTDSLQGGQSVLY